MNPVKKIPVFVLLAVYLFSASASREFLKLPVLVEHYLDHVEENKGIAFVAYLVQHYYTEDGTDMDTAEDNQLPFKSPQNTALSFVSLKPPGSFLIEDKAEMYCNRSFRIRDDRFLLSRFPNAVWQPPRDCVSYLI